MTTKQHKAGGAKPAPVPDTAKAPPAPETDTATGTVAAEDNQAKREMTEAEIAAASTTDRPQPTARELELEGQLLALQEQMHGLEQHDREAELERKVKALENKLARKRTHMDRFAHIPPGVPLRVRAIRLGYYAHKRMREGDVFTVTDKAQLGSWMEIVSNETPERITSGKEQLRQTHEEIRREKSPNLMPAVDAPTGGEDVL